jgi:hypothetical protein
MRGNQKNIHRPRLRVLKAQDEEREIKLQQALAKAKAAERAADNGATKRKSNDLLGRYLSVPLYGCNAIRSESEFQARTYNEGRQVLGLINHLFVKYPVPLFLYRSVLTYEGIDLVFGHQVDSEKRKKDWKPLDSKYLQWFLAVAMGASFAKLAKDVFTKKEAHWFLQAPAGNKIQQNILWAKAAAGGVPRKGCDYLVDRFDHQMLKRIGNRLPDIFRIYADAWDQMHANDRDEITDFIRAMARDQRFSYKGRTYGSLRKLCHEWHRTVYSGYIREYRSWTQSHAPWEHRSKGVVVRAIELTNNRALAEEGRKQRHCVYTYTFRCLHGMSRIVSIRWYMACGSGEDGLLEMHRLTVEVSPSLRSIVQMRGLMNRKVTEEEIKIVRHWAGLQGLTVDRCA